jgi:hypothetical protein
MLGKIKAENCQTIIFFLQINEGILYALYWDLLPRADNSPQEKHSQNKISIV